MRQRIKQLIIVISLIIVGFFLFNIFGPLIIVGSPLSVFSIYNKDENLNHTIIVEIFDSSNSSVLKKTYFLKPEERVEYDRAFGWYPSFSWSFITWSDGEYTFKFILDNETTKIHKTNLYSYKSISVWLY